MICDNSLYRIDIKMYQSNDTGDQKSPDGLNGTIMVSPLGFMHFGIRRRWRPVAYVDLIATQSPNPPFPLIDSDVAAQNPQRDPLHVCGAPPPSRPLSLHPDEQIHFLGAAASTIVASSLSSPRQRELCTARPPLGIRYRQPSPPQTAP